MPCKLKIAVSVVSLVACVLLIALWVRSYYTFDEIKIPLLSPSTLHVSSTEGRLWWYVPNPAYSHLSGVPEYLFVLPHGFFVLLVGTFAVLPWIKWHFSLRTLLIAVTLAAVLLGLIAMFG